MRKDWKSKFKCTFEVLMTKEYREIYTMWFAAATREAARGQAKKYLKKTYKNSFEIISISY